MIRLGSYNLRVLALGVATAGGLAVGVAAALLWYSRRTIEGGPTAASLRDASFAIIGAGIGLMIGSALTGFLLRVAPFVGGVTAGSLAFVFVLVPVLLVAIPDVHAAEVVLAALIAGFPVFVFVLVGALAGSMLSDLREP